MERDTELILYRVDEEKGKRISFGGTYTGEDENVVNLQSDDINFKPIKNWKSPKTGKSYPIEWLIEIPKINLKAKMVAEINNQELIIKQWPQKVIYWEGMCELKGTKDNKEIKGESYLEMTNR